MNGAAALALVLAPLAVALAAALFHRPLLGLFGLELAPLSPAMSGREELRGAMDVLHREGAVVKQDRDRVGGLLDLAELEVCDVMVHRTHMRSLNADDPPYFATSLSREYAVAAAHFGLSRTALLGLTCTAVEAAFVDEETRAVLLARIEAVNPVLNAIVTENADEARLVARQSTQRNLT